MNTFRSKLAALTVVTAVTAACEDIPILPEWDATWNLPVVSQSTRLGTVLPGTLPPGLPPVPDSTLSLQVLDGFVGSTIRDSLIDASLIVQLVKTLPDVSVAETLYLAASRPALATGAGRVAMPFAMGAAETSRTDTLVVPPAGITMLHAIADAEDTLYVMRRGTLNYTGPGGLAVTPNDSIGVRIGLLARIAVSR